MSKEYKHHHHHHHHITTTTNFLPRLCRASTQDIKQLVILPKFSGDPSSPRVSCTGHVKHSRKVTGFPIPQPKSTATPTDRRQIHNSTHSNQTNFTRSTSTTAAAAAVCGCRRGSIVNLNSNISTCKAGDSQKSLSPRTPETAAADINQCTHAPARGLILNSKYSVIKAGSINRTTFDKSKTGSWIILNTTVTGAGKSNLNYSKLKRLFAGKNSIEPSTGTNCKNREVNMVNFRRRPELESGRNYDVAQDPPLPVVKKIKKPGFDREEVNLWKRRSSKSGIELKNLKIQKIHEGNNNNNNYHTSTSVSFFDDIL